MNLHDGRLLTTQVVAVLTLAGLVVGRAVKPATGGGQAGGTWNAYVVVYPLSGGVTDGPIDNSDDDANVLYQLTAVGVTAEQCEWQADVARQAVLAGVYTLADRKIVHVAVDMLGGVIRDDDVQPPVFSSPDRYRFTTVPT